jgi:hypothetical protein
MAFVGYKWQTYFSLSAGVLGTATNLINISVLINPKLKDTSYKYMLTKSIVDIIYLILSIPYQAVNYCYNCPHSITYSANIYNILIGIYLMPCLAIFSILIEIILSVYIYSMLVNRHWFTKWRFWRSIFVSAIIGLVFYISRLFAFNIVYRSKFQGFYSVYSTFGQSQTYQILTILQYAVRIVLGVGILTSINAVNAVKFRKRFSHRLVGYCFPSQTGGGFSGLNKDSRSIKNITKMAIVSAFFKVFLEMPYSTCVIINLAGVVNSDFVTFYYITGGLLYLSPSLDFLVYYLFNKNYRNILNGYLRLKF